jgi:uncharacterized lipoprotein YehR (DUF1307 family)
MKKRTLAILLFVLLALCSFASCGDMTVAELETASAEKLENSPYKATMALTMSTDNATLDAMISQMNFSMALSVDGDAIQAVMSMGEQTLGSFVYIDNCLYLDADGEKEKATATKEQFEKFYNDALGSMGFTEASANMFNKSELIKNEDGTYTVTYSEIKADALKELVGDEAEMPDLTNVTLKITYDKKGACQKLDMTYSMDMTAVIGSAATVSASMTTTFEYSDVSITAPADAASYTEFDINDMLGE